MHLLDKSLVIFCVRFRGNADETPGESVEGRDSYLWGPRVLMDEGIREK